MDEDRESYILRAIYDTVEATRIVEDFEDLAEDLEEEVDKYSIANRFYIAGLIKAIEYNHLCERFKKDDELWESIVNKTADLDQLHRERLDQIEAFLFGGTSSEAIDGIIQWINSPDCSKRELVRLKEAIDKTLG